MCFCDDYCSSTLTCCSCCNLQCCGFVLLLLIIIKATAKVNFVRIWCITNATPARRVTPPWSLHGKIWPRLGGLPGLADRANRHGGSHLLSCKRNQIKMRDYMDRRVTTAKRVTSLTWGPPPPCKQALRSLWKFHVVVVQNNGKEMYQKSVLHVQSCFFAN